MGVVGAGFGGYGLTPAFRCDERFDVVAIATSSPESAQRAMQRYGIERAASWQELVASDDIDAVGIAVPPATQFEIAVAALDQGKHVLAEKPLAQDHAAAVDLAEKAETLGLANMVDFIFPELETWRKAKMLLEEGAVGDVRHAFLDWRMESYDNRHRKAGWKTESDIGGGVLNHFGCHTFYYLEWLLGSIKSLGAVISTAPDCRQTGDTLAALSMTFEQGATAAVSLSNASVCGSGHRLEIGGTEGSLALTNESLNPVEGFELRLATRKEAEWKLLATEEQPSRPEEQDSRVVPVARLAARFADWILDDVAAKPDFSNGARVQSLLEASAASNRHGGAQVDVEPLSDRNSPG